MRRNGKLKNFGDIIEPIMVSHCVEDSDPPVYERKSPPACMPRNIRDLWFLAQHAQGLFFPTPMYDSNRASMAYGIWSPPTLMMTC